MSVWQDVPFTFKLDSKTESIDVAMKKVVWEKAKQCDSSDLSSDHRIVNSYIGIQIFDRISAGYTTLDFIILI